MILLIGHGYIGETFAKEMSRRGMQFRWGSHGDKIDLSEIKSLDLIINCAAFIPKPTVALCDKFPKETIEGNLLFPIALASTGVPLMHVSTGCLFNDPYVHLERDTPQRGFDGYAGIYVGTKLMSEEAVSKFEKHYVLRIRLPFDGISSDRNYLNKISAHPKVWEQVNSLSHRSDIANASLDLFEKEAPYGIYHMANEGDISNREVIERMKKAGVISGEKEFVQGAVTDCRLSIEKLKSAGVKIRHVSDAVDESIRNWKKA